MCPWGCPQESSCGESERMGVVYFFSMTTSTWRPLHDNQYTWQPVHDNHYMSTSTWQPVHDNQYMTTSTIWQALEWVQHGRFTVSLLVIDLGLATLKYGESKNACRSSDGIAMSQLSYKWHTCVCYDVRVRECGHLWRSEVSGDRGVRRSTGLWLHKWDSRLSELTWSLWWKEISMLTKLHYRKIE